MHKHYATKYLFIDQLRKCFFFLFRLRLGWWPPLNPKNKIKSRSTHFLIDCVSPIVSVHDLSAWPISLIASHTCSFHTLVIKQNRVCFVVVVAVFFLFQSNKHTQSQAMTTGKLSDGHVNRPRNYPTVGCVFNLRVCVCVWEII